MVIEFFWSWGVKKRRINSSESERIDYCPCAYFHCKWLQILWPHAVDATCMLLCFASVGECCILTGMVWLPWSALIADWASVCVENLTKAQPRGMNRSTYVAKHILQFNHWCLKALATLLKKVDHFCSNRCTVRCSAGCLALSIRQAEKQAAPAG